MNRLLLALALAIATAAPAAAQYYGYSGGGCSAPCYGPSCYTTPSYSYGRSYGHSYGYRSQWSGWTYGPWATDAKYYVRYRTWYDHCGVATNHNDGWLYCLDGHGCYVKHCLISQYAAKPLIYPTSYIEPVGKTEVGYYKPEHDVARAFPYLVKLGVIAATENPRFLDPRSVLAPLNDQSAARHAFVDNTVKSTTDLALKIAAQEQANEAEKIRARDRLARQAQNDNTKLSILAKLNEIVATLDNKITIDAEATPRAVINVANPELARLIQDKCVICHGPGKAEKGLNFAAVAQNDADVWRKVNRKVATGQMPPSEPIDSDEELGLFEDQMILAVKAR